MKLGKLLAAGKSVMKGQAEVSYRSSKQIYLPKFGSSKNPFKPGSPTQECETTPSPGSAEAATEPRGTAGGPTRLAPPDESGAGQALAPHSEVAAGSGRGSDDAQSVRPSAIPLSNAQSVTRNPPSANGGRSSRLAPLFSIFRAVFPAGTTRRPDNATKGQKAMATQTELSLDAVKVVHNDLSDVDVEVVPMKSRSAAPELGAPKKSWEFVGERLFGVEAT
jgi:hypothetical protein